MNVLRDTGKCFIEVWGIHWLHIYTSRIDKMLKSIDTLWGPLNAKISLLIVLYTYVNVKIYVLFFSRGLAQACQKGYITGEQHRQYLAWCGIKISKYLDFRRLPLLDSYYCRCMLQATNEPQLASCTQPHEQQRLRL